MAEKHQCCEMVWTPGMWGHRRKCTKNATVERDGRWYCSSHDPVKKQERSEKQEHERQRIIENRERDNKRYQLRQKISDWCIDNADKLPPELAAMVKELDALSAPSDDDQLDEDRTIYEQHR